MNWFEYRHLLGLSYADEEQFGRIKNAVRNYIMYHKDFKSYSGRHLLDFCILTGVEVPTNTRSSTYNEDLNILINKLTNSTLELICYCVAIINTYTKRSLIRPELVKNFTAIFENNNVKLDFIQDNKNLFILPLGAPELDNALVSEPLLWLSEYPISRESFIVAIKQYSNSEYARDIADNLRKSLEDFLHEFFKNEKNLDNNISEISKYLKSMGGSERITSIFKNILNAYNEINNECAKHHNKIEPIFLEFLMYQTGLFIRMMILTKKLK